MTTHRGLFRSVVGSTGLLISFVLLLIWPSGILEAATIVRLAWDANIESDLAGYRIKYGTASGNYTLPTIDVGRVNSHSIPNLQSTTTYYFVVTAYDLAGNESSPSNEIAARPTVTTGVPTIDQAIEVGTGSVYLLQSGSQTIQISGSNFQIGAGVSLGADIGVGTTSVLDSGHLTSPVVVSPSAALGPRGLNVTNPDGGTASRPSALTVVKTTDINRDCRIDLLDMNLLARSWNTRSSDADYIASADLDGDGEVGGIDLVIFVTYFGQRLAVCP